MQEAKRQHEPVLVKQVLEVLQPQKGESYLDLTAGYGGHAEQILAKTQNYKEAVFVDRDEMAVEYLQAKYQTKGVQICHSDFYKAALSLVKAGQKFDLILADLGVSSPQLDQAERGFSLNKEARLDMRMDKTQSLDAWTVVNKYSERELARILRDFGEVSQGQARLIAKKIVLERPINTTIELAELVRQVVHGHKNRHPATPIFQAIRIVVNDELGELRQTLAVLPDLLKPGGRLAIISFHSLEDWMVKHFLKTESSTGLDAALALIYKKALIADHSEVVNNPRARSAKLRAARKN